LLVTFRSITFPVISFLTIEMSVWINLAMPYLSNTPLAYIGYVIINTVQIGATVVSAYFFTEHYTKLRIETSAWKSAIITIEETTFSIGVSASILSSVGFILSATSSDPIVSSIGLLLGRGALLAFLAVLFLLPALLVVIDRIIEKTTWKPNFFKDKEE